MSQWTQKKASILFVFFILFGILGFIHVKNELSTTRGKQQNNGPIHRLTGFKLIEYNDKGELKQSLNARSIVQSSEDKILLSFPKVTHYLPSGKINKISADSGIYFPKHHLIHFNNNVLIDELDEKKHLTITSMKTTSLVFNTKTELATSKDWVYIQKPNMAIEALGIVSNLKKETLSFPGKTKMRYTNLS